MGSFPRLSLFIVLVLFHLALGGAVFVWPVIGWLWMLLAALGGIAWICITRNTDHQVLVAAAYMTGFEVFGRMADCIPSHEFVKYMVLLYAVLGLLYTGFTRSALVFIIFLLLLVPGVLWATQVLELTRDVRKSIVFNVLGPLTLGIMSLYTYRKNMRWDQLQQVLWVLGLPMLCALVYLQLYQPDIRNALRGTGSNDMLSGGYGPNQVSTLLGLTAFVYFCRLLLASPTRLWLLIHGLLFSACVYRGLLTFSRGGMLTLLVMLLVTLWAVYRHVDLAKRRLLAGFWWGLCVVGMGVWGYTSFQTQGLLDKRYANQDSLGRSKQDQSTGRLALALDEVDMFLNHPFFGVGVAKGTELRSIKFGSASPVASHNECTRMLAEHGLFGLVALVLLLWVPLRLYHQNPQHLLRAAFFVFWLLTVNHSAMRTVAPAFVYALALVQLQWMPDRPIAVNKIDA